MTGPSTRTSRQRWRRPIRSLARCVWACGGAHVGTSGLALSSQHLHLLDPTVCAHLALLPSIPRIATALTGRPGHLLQRVRRLGVELLRVGRADARPRALGPRRRHGAQPCRHVQGQLHRHLPGSQPHRYVRALHCSASTRAVNRVPYRRSLASCPRPPSVQPGPSFLPSFLQPSGTTPRIASSRRISATSRASCRR